MLRVPLRPDTRLAARNDGRWVVVATLLTFAASSAFELQERLASLELRLERWQVDELPLTLTVLALGLAWMAWRRGRESARLLAHNRELAQQLIALQESERRALARELHDELAQHCTAIRIEAAYIQRAQDAAQVAAAAQRTADEAGLLCDSIRNLLRRLRPAELDELGLPAALQALCAACADRHGFACVFESRALPTTFDDALAIALYRVAQEGLSNAVRHAGASVVRVSLVAGDGGVELRIDDDGCGFDPATGTRGLGLLGAFERAAALGATLDVRSAPGAGTTLRLPVPRAAGTVRAGWRAEARSSLA